MLLLILLSLSYLPKMSSYIASTRLMPVCKKIFGAENSFISHTKSIRSINQHFRLFASLQRIERIISNRGVGSRSEVSKLLKQGRVKVNGKVERSSSNKYPEDVPIEIDGVSIQEVSLLAVYHKPVGIISSVGDPWGRPNLEGVYANHSSLLSRDMHPVGRLDSDTSGLLLFSKDGALTQHLLSPQSGIPRTYEALVLGAVAHTQLKEVLAKGVETTDGVFGGVLVHSEVLDTEVRGCDYSYYTVEMNVTISLLCSCYRRSVHDRYLVLRCCQLFDAC